MGPRIEGEPLHWDDAKEYATHIRDHGVTQFLNVWRKFKSRQNDVFTWGEEIEYMIVSFDDQAKKVDLSLRQTEILEAIPKLYEKIRKQDPEEAKDLPVFQPEFGRYMVEAIPASPYTGSLADLLSVEAQMRLRRTVVQQLLGPHEKLLTLTSFPRLGADGVRAKSQEPSTPGLFLPRDIISEYKRYTGLARAVAQRRGSKVAINVPIYRDKNTPQPFVDPGSLFTEHDDDAALPDHIYLDSLTFGAGCCCLQVTVQAADLEQSKRIYDALVPVAPIMLALTAASPIYKGYLADVDCRWNVFAQSVDDRTEEERNLKPLKENKFRVPQFRIASSYSYLSEDARNRPEYNDSNMPYDDEVFGRLRDSGVDELLARHIARLYVRDPLLVIPGKIDQDDETSIEHFENIQTSNWPTVRFKIPPPDGSTGWLLEFRSMEVQLTDFGNAAFSMFIVLLVRAIVAYDVNFYIPISKVDANMERAQKRGALSEQKFWFRKNVFSATKETSSMAGHGSIEEECEEMTAQEIFNGKGDGFPGLFGLVDRYVAGMEAKEEEKAVLEKYLNLVRQRANGTLLTTAAWMRKFVQSHPGYAHDSVVSEEINYDLIRTLDEIARGAREGNDLLPADYAEGRSPPS
ncbi:hypothetical protein BOTBODRAFT_27552 [Botryobasidium botryosum FD-172 SS1]|uniref:Glutamate--cysteine ligase n=1 Tax=Botryobasidium botryosum (strain FD-172 SS1) TaxID=930990 RepID=A0A067N7M9_BOTB1|nr:hypothetical protein BOTBODRAFT_27552 [Botryobasidium botryosum FD-172 SS1]